MLRFLVSKINIYKHKIKNHLSNKGNQNFHLRKIFVDTVHTFIIFKNHLSNKGNQNFHLRKIFVDTVHTFIIFKITSLIREIKIFINPDQSIPINLINPDQSGSHPIF